MHAWTIAAAHHTVGIPDEEPARMHTGSKSTDWDRRAEGPFWKALSLTVMAGLGPATHDLLVAHNERPVRSY
jgi:hypothetical protein